MSEKAAQDLEKFLAGGRFGCVMAGPPWRFPNCSGKVAPEHKRLSRYPSMTLDDICALPVHQHLEDRAYCCFWVPDALLPDADCVLDALGFDDKSNIVWHKIRKDGGSDRRGVHDGWTVWGNQADADYKPGWKTYAYNSTLPMAAE